ncbi:MBL fold metallo-hydrolase [Maridesulfovibrio sp.]|uniref:MBL fold metallo-hydrolase n=1 Tax=Maridesulfovibrio sp. TaxID=2795000 RepID=UPI0029CA8ECB|nr:MBL fold metallo-hydrolase [Maridesulfovibrio sp.]
MKFQQIRNATVIIEYANTRFLIDPMLSAKESFPGFPGTVNNELSNPLVELPLPISELLKVDAVILTHTHLDHWDETAKNTIPKEMPIFVQNEQDRAEVEQDGFTNIQILGQETEFKGIRMTKTSGQHGSDKIMTEFGQLLGSVCGIVFMHPTEKTVYLAGDTIWNRFVDDSIKKHSPDIIILNSGDAQIIGLGSIIMGKQDVLKVHEAAPDATIIATHMEAVNHATLSRNELREFTVENEFEEMVLIPQDGETLTLNS